MTTFLEKFLIPLFLAVLGSKKHFSGKIGLYVPSRKKLKIKLKIKKLKIMNGYHGKMQTE